MNVITRFAPSPTGALHIGGARTALFNYLFSQNNKGKFYLRIEDTDKERSKKEYENQIITSLKWLGINFNEPIVYQSKNIDEHIKIAQALLDKGHAYKCYCTPEELEEKKNLAKKNKINYIYDKKCRTAKEQNKPHCIRFKVNTDATTTIDDGVQGKVLIENSTIEDFVILRSDNTPTYNLSASVDDFLMKITHVIRGDDHKINAIKQIQIFMAMKWNLPKYYHIPLIHSEEGKKLSKRDSASTVEDYNKIGILPQALRNYLIRLGWSYQDKEIFSDEEMIKLFNLENIGKSPSKLSFERIKSLNEHYIKTLDNKFLFEKFKSYILNYKKELMNEHLDKIFENFNIFKNKAKTLEDIFLNCSYIFDYRFDKTMILSQKTIEILEFFTKEIKALDDFDETKIKEILDKTLSKYNLNFKDLGQPLRLVLTASKHAPSIIEIIKSLGIKESVKRLGNIG